MSSQPQFLSFNPAMLAAVRARRKTVTRRRFSPGLPLHEEPDSYQFLGMNGPTALFTQLAAPAASAPLAIVCPFGAPGTRLRVTEAPTILLEVMAVRAEQVQAITEAQALAEGVEPGAESAVAAFRALIDSIYPTAWARNEWVWVLEFERVG